MKVTKHILVLFGIFMNVSFLQAQIEKPTNVIEHRIEGSFAIIQYDITGSDFTYAGVCYNTTGNPNAADDESVDRAISSTGTYQDSLEPLTDNGETYYYHAYVTDGTDTLYSDNNDTAFVTQKYSQPTSSVSNFTATAKDSNRIDLDWDAVASAGFYAIKYVKGTDAPSTDDLVDSNSAIPLFWNHAEATDVTYFTNDDPFNDLDKNQTYTFLIMPGNNKIDDQYANLRQDHPVTAQATTFKGLPSTQSSNITITDTTEESFTAQWTKGSGDRSVVFINTENSFSVSNGDNYTANTSWGGGSTQQCVYNGTGNSVTVTNYSNTDNFYIRVYEMNNPGTKEYYNKNTPTGNPDSLLGFSVWDGSSSTSWSTDDNWNHSRVPETNQRVRIPDVGSNNNPSLSSTVTTNKLEIEADGELTITSSGDLTVDGDLTIASNSSANGALINTGGSITINGKAIYNRFVADDDAWHLASAPANTTDITSMSGYYANSWSEEDTTWVNLTASDNIANMKGYSVNKSDNPDNTDNNILEFSGSSFYDTSQSITVYNTNTSHGKPYGWNLVGNPYPCPIDWDASSGWTRSHINATVYQYNPETSSYDSYSHGSKSGKASARYIQAGQGFFIFVDDEGSYPFGMNNDVKVSSDQNFLKKPIVDKSELTLHISNNTKEDDTYIVFIPGATENYDHNYDGYKMLGWKEDLPQIYTLLDNDREMVINSFSNEVLDTLSGIFEIPVGFDTKIDKSFTFSITDTYQIPDSTNIYIADNVTGDTVNLLKQNYQFNADAGVYNQRFKLLIEKNAVPKGQWTGAISNNWDLADNWSYNDKPTTNTDVTIPASVERQPVISSLDNTIRSLTIQSDAELVIEPEANLTLEKDFLNNGTFTIQSDTSGTGSIITNGDISGNGAFAVNQYLTAQRWWYLASPVKKATSTVFSPDINNRLFYWNETENGTHGWNEIKETTELTPLKGYAYYKSSTGAKTVSFEGMLNNGNYGSATNLTAEGSTKTGYNLVGNPYPSAINLGDYENLNGISIQNLAPTVWYRANEKFATLNWSSGTGTNGAQPIVPPMQGFWVKVENAETGSLQVDNAARVHPTHDLYKSAEDNVLRLKIQNNNLWDETAIGFYKAAKNKLDKFDSEKLFAGTSGLPEIYTIQNGKKLAINGLNATITNDITIPIGLRTERNGEYTIEATNIHNFNITNNVLLEDLQNDKTILLNSNPVYTFYSNAGEIENRFLIHFEQTETDINSISQNIQIYGHENHIFIRHNEPGTGQVKIFNVLGKLVHTGILNKKGLTKIPVTGKGYFIVKVVNKAQSVTEKVIIH